MALSKNHLDRALFEDERHGGWGFAASEMLPSGIRHLARVHVIREANKLGLDYEGLFLFVDSKLARWLCDELESAAAHEVPALVRRYLNAVSMEGLREYGVSSPSGVR